MVTIQKLPERSMTVYASSHCGEVNTFTHKSLPFPSPPTYSVAIDSY